MSLGRSTKSFLILLMGIVFAALLARCAIHLASHNYNLAAVANGLYGILDVSEEKSLYPTRSAKPYRIYLYPPLHAFFNGTLLKLSPLGSLRAKVITVRVISFLALLLSLYIFWKVLIRPRNISGLAYLLTLALGLSKFADYATTTRNDTFSLLIEVAALCTFICWIRSKEKKYLVYFLPLIVLSVLTRQTGIVVAASALVWLIYQKRFKEFFAVLNPFLLLSLGTYLVLNVFTSGAFFEQVILANMRGFRPINIHFFDYSFLSFCFSYLLFAYLLYQGVREIFKKEPSPEVQYLLVVFVLSLLSATSLFLRAGGDINYYFEAIFIGFFFCAWTIDKILKSEVEGSAKYFTRTILAGQIALIAFVYGYKTQSAYQLAFLPYEEAAEEIRSKLPSFGYLSGRYSLNMNIHLRDWSIHGPDVTNAGQIAKNAHPNLRWILKDSVNSIADGTLQSAIIAEEDCQRHGKFLPEIPFDPTLFGKFVAVESSHTWLCLYQAPS